MWKRMVLVTLALAASGCGELADRLTGVRPPAITCPDTLSVTPGVSFKIPLACTTLYRGAHR
jgi:hypothetical protein